MVGRRFGWRVGFWIAHGFGRTRDSLSEFPDVTLGCAGVSGTDIQLDCWNLNEAAFQAWISRRGRCLDEVRATVATLL